MDPTIETERRSRSDRRRARGRRFFERRSGFDRRAPNVVLGTLRDSRWLLPAVLVTVNLMSLADGALTYAEITHGIAHEGNPILAALFEVHPMAAIAFKVLSVFLVTAIIWAARRQRSMIALSLFASAVFSAVLAYHFGSLAGLGLL